MSIPCPKCGQPMVEARACPGWRPILWCMPKPKPVSEAILAHRLRVHPEKTREQLLAEDAVRDAGLNGCGHQLIDDAAISYLRDLQRTGAP